MAKGLPLQWGFIDQWWPTVFVEPVRTDGMISIILLKQLLPNYTKHQICGLRAQAYASIRRQRIRSEDFFRIQMVRHATL